MQFVVGTHSFLILVEIDRSWKVKDFQVLGKGHHYGIGLLENNDSEFIAKGGVSGEGEKFTVWGKTDSESHSAFYSSKKNFTLPDNEFGHIHQISGYKNGIFLANTRYNSIDYITLDNDQNLERPSLRYTFDNVKYDFNHINSIYPLGKKDLLVVLNNRGRIESEIVLMEVIYENHSIKELLYRKRLRTWHKGCHNVFADQELLTYNASADGDFVIVDLLQDKKIRNIHFPGHVKGLSVTKDYFIIGYSEFAKRQSRNKALGYLAVIDRHTFKLVLTVDLNHPSLPHPVGNVNEVRCLNEKDYGHSSTKAIGKANFHSLKFSSGDWKHPFVDKYNAVQRLLRRGFGQPKI